MKEALFYRTVDQIKQHLATEFKLLRTELHGLSRKALSEKSDISKNTIQRFEETGDISLNSLIALAKAMEVEKKFISLFEMPDYQTLEEYENRLRAKMRRKKGK